MNSRIRVENIPGMGMVRTDLPTAGERRCTSAAKKHLGQTPQGRTPIPKSKSDQAAKPDVRQAPAGGLSKPPESAEPPERPTNADQPSAAPEPLLINKKAFADFRGAFPGAANGKSEFTLEKFRAMYPEPGDQTPCFDRLNDSERACDYEVIFFAMRITGDLCSLLKSRNLAQTAQYRLASACTHLMDALAHRPVPNAKGGQPC